MGERKIIHIDTDAFYASVEQRDHPELCGKPLIVGHAKERGVVVVASYEARRYGMRSAMSSRRAKRLYLQPIFVPGWTDMYKSVPHRVYEIFHEYTDLIEFLSLDEAFPDVAENKQEILLAVDMTGVVKRRICEELNLIAPAGVSHNKFLVKIASDFRKPDELCIIHSGQAFDFIARLPIESFWGAGPVVVREMYLLDIHNDPQLRDCSSEVLVRQFNKAGLLYYDFARGIDLRPAEAVWVHKSIGYEHTLKKSIHVEPAVIIELYHAATELVERLQWKDFRRKTLTLRIKFHDFSQITRSTTQAQGLTSLERILPPAKQLLKEVEYEQHPIRLIGLLVSNPKEGTDERRGVWEQLGFEFSDWGRQLKIGIRG